MDFSTLAKLRKHLNIQHHIPGRIRIKYDWSLAAHPQVRELLRDKPALPPGIRSARLNPAARSVVVEYEARWIPKEVLEELLTTRDEARAVEILQELERTLQQPKTEEVH